jgi:hypothetical protein
MVRFAGIAIALVLLIVVFSACGKSPSGVEGVAFASGGPFPGDPQPIASAKVFVHENDAAGKVVATAVTGPDGKFKLELEPGTYSVDLTTRTGYPLKDTAHVTSGEYAQVELVLPMK